jgi:hypothetical protein
MLSKFETMKSFGFDRDEDGYVLLHKSVNCVRCRRPVALRSFKDPDKRRRAQILGYCQQCFLEIMGW